MGFNTEKQDSNNSDVMAVRVTNEVDLMGYLKNAGDKRITLADNVESVDVENVDGDTTVHITTKTDDGETREMTLYGDGDFNLLDFLNVKKFEYVVKNLPSIYDNIFNIYKIGKLCFLNTLFRTKANLSSGGFINICDLDDELRLPSNTYYARSGVYTVTSLEFLGTVGVDYSTNKLSFYTRTTSSIPAGTYICVSLFWECA